MKSRTHFPCYSRANTQALHSIFQQLHSSLALDPYFDGYIGYQIPMIEEAQLTEVQEIAA
jgi:hypothetical protein